MLSIFNISYGLQTYLLLVFNIPYESYALQTAYAYFYT